MGEQQFQISHLSNGISLVGEEMPHASSAAVSILVPVGAASDPTGQEGITSMLLEMLGKGAGPWDTRGLSEQFDKLGVSHGLSAGVEASTFYCAGLSDKIESALQLIGHQLLQPHLPAEDLESVRELALQDLNSIEDEPAQKVMIELAKRYYPHPFGRSQLGDVPGVRAVTIESLRSRYQEAFGADRVVIGVAGRFRWSKFRSVVERTFGGWSGATPKPVAEEKERRNVSFHIEKDTAQSQIALAYPSVPYGHPDYYVARLAVGVLSGGMAGRLFVEVREKRGLVYSVSASHSASRGRAAVFAYAGTTPERSAETLEVLIGELTKLKQGVSEEELDRAKTDLKAKVIMQSELSSVRAGSIVHDWWNLGQVRTVEEVKRGIEAVTAADIVRHLEQFPVQGVTLVTLGPKALELKL